MGLGDVYKRQNVETVDLLVATDLAVVTWLSISNPAIRCGEDYGFIDVGIFPALSAISASDADVCRCLCSAHSIPYTMHHCRRRHNSALSDAVD